MLKSGIFAKSVFISRKLDETSVFKHYLESKSKYIIDEPLIKITQIPFSYTPQTQWIFFSSKNAIKHFFAQSPSISSNTKYGVISESSAVYLNTYGKQADFIGQGVDLGLIAKSFRDVLGNDSVLFPQAMDSLQSIQKYLAFSNTTYNLYTYKTILRQDIDIPYTDVLVFTSPSNVMAYLNKYSIDSRQLVIAMGQSTKFKLSENGIKDVLTPGSFNEEGLLNTLIDQFSKTEKAAL